MEPAHKRESKEGRDCVGFAHRTVPCTQVPVQNTKQQTRAEVYRLSRKENPKKAGNHVDGPRGPSRMSTGSVVRVKELERVKKQG